MLLNLADPQVRAPDRLAKRQGRSRASLIRDAVDEYVRRYGVERGDEAFGSWGRDLRDGLAFQVRARREW
jgi:hypothetical protein